MEEELKLLMTGMKTGVALSHSNGKPQKVVEKDFVPRIFHGFLLASAEASATFTLTVWSSEPLPPSTLKTLTFALSEVGHGCRESHNKLDVWC